MQLLRNYPARVGPGPASVACDVVQSGDRCALRSHRTMERQGHRSDWRDGQWHSDSLDVHGDYTRLVPLDGRIVTAGWSDMEAGWRVSGKASNCTVNPPQRRRNAEKKRRKRKIGKGRLFFLNL